MNLTASSGADPDISSAFKFDPPGARMGGDGGNLLDEVARVFGG